MLWIATALAASPGGYHASPGLPVDMVRFRTATTVLRQRLVHENHILGRVHFGSFSAAIELPAIVSVGTDVGLGSTQVGLYHHFGTPNRHVMFGFEYLFFVGPPGAVNRSYASQFHQTAPVHGFLTVLELAAAPRSPIHMRIALGTVSDIGLNSRPFQTLRMETLFAAVIPITPRWSVVGETEFTTDQNWFSVRALGRLEGSRFALDVGVQRGVFNVYDLLTSLRVYR